MSQEDGRIPIPVLEIGRMVPVRTMNPPNPPGPAPQASKAQDVPPTIDSTAKTDVNGGVAAQTVVRPLIASSERKNELSSDPVSKISSEFSSGLSLDHSIFADASEDPTLHSARFEQPQSVLKAEHLDTQQVPPQGSSSRPPSVIPQSDESVQHPASSTISSTISSEPPATHHTAGLQQNLWEPVHSNPPVQTVPSFSSDVHPTTRRNLWEPVNSNPQPAAPPPKIPPPPNQQDTPKGALYTWLNKEKRICLSGNDYLTYYCGQDHQKWFTSLLKHPQTGEVFPSGRFGDTSDFMSEPAPNGDMTAPSIVWYRSKKMAEHGAAAVAYDCLTYRNGLKIGRQYEQMGLDPPSEHQLPLPEGIAERFQKC